MGNEVETLTLSVLMGTMSKAWLGYGAPTQIEIVTTKFIRFSEKIRLC